MSDARRLLALLTLLAAPLPGQARISVLAGGGSSNLQTATADQLPNKSARSGFVAGAGLSLPLAGRLSFTPEVTWVQKGANGTDNARIVVEEAKLTYLEVPLMLHLALGRGRLQPFLLGGGAVAFKLSCKLHFSGLGQDLTEECQTGNADVSGTDFGLVGGGGLAFGRIAASVRYTHGLKNINTQNQGNNAVRNRTVMGVVRLTL